MRRKVFVSVQYHTKPRRTDERREGTTAAVFEAYPARREAEGRTNDRKNACLLGSGAPRFEADIITESYFKQTVGDHLEGVDMFIATNH